MIVSAVLMAKLKAKFTSIAFSRVRNDIVTIDASLLANYGLLDILLVVAFL